jgi:hypothetical protein
MEGRNLVLLLLVLAVVIVGAVTAANVDPVPAALAQAQLGIDAAPVTASPTGVAIAGLWKVLGGLLGVLLIVGLGYLIWERVQARRSGGGWVSGPNANFGRVPQKKQPTFMDVMAMMAYSQMRKDQPPNYDVPAEREKARFS